MAEVGAAALPVLVGLIPVSYTHLDVYKRQGLDQTFELKAIACDGIEACRMALLKASKKVLPANFIEGMACIGGCIGGAGCLTHGDKNKADVDKYGMEAMEKTITDAIGVLKK